VECGVLVAGVALAAASTHSRVPSVAQGLLLGAAAGALFGVSDMRAGAATSSLPEETFVKALT
jgi:hypothetical protein